MCARPPPPASPQLQRRAEDAEVGDEEGGVDVRDRDVTPVLLADVAVSVPATPKAKRDTASCAIACNDGGARGGTARLAPQRSPPWRKILHRAGRRSEPPSPRSVSLSETKWSSLCSLLAHHSKCSPSAITAARNALMPLRRRIARLSPRAVVVTTTLVVSVALVAAMLARGAGSATAALQHAVSSLASMARASRDERRFVATAALAFLTVAALIAGLPPAPLEIACGFALGAVSGGALALVAKTIGCCAAFALGRASSAVVWRTASAVAIAVSSSFEGEESTDEGSGSAGGDIGTVDSDVGECGDITRHRDETSQGDEVGRARCAVAAPTDVGGDRRRPAHEEAMAASKIETTSHHAQSAARVLRALRRAIKRAPWRGALLAAAAPLPCSVKNYGMAAMPEVTLGTFAVATLLAGAPYSALLALAGSTLVSLEAEAGGVRDGSLQWIHIVVAALAGSTALAIAAAAAFAVRRELAEEERTDRKDSGVGGVPMDAGCEQAV